MQIAAGQGTMTINSGTGTRTLTLGTGGLTIGTGAGNTNLNVGVILNGDQTWNNNGGTLLMNNALSSISGTGNLTINGNFNAGAASLGNLTGTVRLNGQSDLNGNFLNSASGGVTIATGTVGAQGGAIATGTATTFTGTTNWYTNGNSAVFSGAVSGGAMSTIGTGNLTLSGIADNTGLSVTTPGGTTFLAKTSSATVHAIGGTLTLASSSTAQITGTGGDQIKDSGKPGNQHRGHLRSERKQRGHRHSLGHGGRGDQFRRIHNEHADGRGNSGGGTFGGIIQNGTGVTALTKTGTGNATLTGANTYTGGTTVNRGTLTLDFSAAAPASILDASSTVALGGGTLSVKAPPAGRRPRPLAVSR